MSHALHFVDFIKYVTTFFLLLLFFDGLVSSSLVCFFLCCCRFRRDLSSFTLSLLCVSVLWCTGVANREKWIFIKPFVCCCIARAATTILLLARLESAVHFSTRSLSNTHTQTVFAYPPKRPLKTIYPLLFHRFLCTGRSSSPFFITTQFRCNFFFVARALGGNGWLASCILAALTRLLSCHCIVCVIFCSRSRVCVLCASGEWVRSSVLCTCSQSYCIGRHRLVIACNFIFFSFFRRWLGVHIQCYQILLFVAL